MLNKTDTNQENQKVYDALYGSGNDEELIARYTSKETGFIDSITRQSLRRLRPGEWLNDEVIHFFYLLLAMRDASISPKKRCNFFKSFFITKLLDEGVSNNAPCTDIFELDKIFIPVNIDQVHWACAVVFFDEKRIQMYDSLGNSGTSYLEAILLYLKDEWNRMCADEELPNWKEWKLVTTTLDTPNQENKFDCGVFTCMYADYLSINKPLDFTQEQVNIYRERIALSILRGSIDN